MGEARNVILINSADAVIAIGGGRGTLPEIAFAQRAGLAVFGLDTWGTANDAPLVEMVPTTDELMTRAVAAARARRS
jgi:hypothetical protein